MAANPPRMPTGTIGTSKAVASWAAPSRNRPICPSDDRVPSGKTTRFQCSLSRAPAVDRDGSEHERGGDRPQPAVEEVVGCGGDSGPRPPRRGQGTQDQRRVQVRGVVGDEQHRTGHPVQRVQAADLRRDLRPHQRLEPRRLHQRSGSHGGRRASPSGRELARRRYGDVSGDRGRQRRAGAPAPPASDLAQTHLGARAHRTSEMACGGECR